MLVPMLVPTLVLALVLVLIIPALVLVVVLFFFVVTVLAARPFPVPLAGLGGAPACARPGFSSYIFFLQASSMRPHYTPCPAGGLPVPWWFLRRRSVTVIARAMPRLPDPSTPPGGVRH